MNAKRPPQGPKPPVGGLGPAPVQKGLHYCQLVLNEPRFAPAPPSLPSVAASQADSSRTRGREDAADLENVGETLADIQLTTRFLPPPSRSGAQLNDYGDDFSDVTA